MISKSKFGPWFVNHTGNALYFKRTEESAYPLRVALSEVELLIKALGTLAATEQLDFIPDELVFSPFVFSYDKDNKVFILSRNDETNSGWVTTSYNRIDDFQIYLSNMQNNMINKHKQKGRVLPRF